MEVPAKPAGLKSMTGFAAARGHWEAWEWSVDVRSVNGRGLDLRLRIPDWVEGLEPQVRSLLKASVDRGSVTLSVKLQKDDSQAGAQISSTGLAAALGKLRTIEEAARASGLTLAPASATDIAAMRGVLEQGETIADTPAELVAEIMKSITRCVADFLADRAREGAKLGRVIEDQVATIESLTLDAQGTLGDRDTAAREAMTRAIARLMETETGIDEPRLTQELALIAVKTDVTEEIDRLHAHIDAARKLISDAGPVGRRLDFLMQEFNREANTLCSKAQSTTLTAIGLDLKATIDQMREQVQNLE